MRVRSVPRERDDEILGWLAARVLGVPWAHLAQRAGIAVGTIKVTCRNVRDADRAEAGEPVPAEAYP